MAFDGVITKSIVTELNNTIINGKINKVFEPNKNEIILGIYSNGKNYALNIVISANNYRLNLTNNSKPNPSTAPNFCMLLRKHLIGAKIKNISMNGLERIITICFQCYNELNDLTEKNLIIELMGKHSNIILTNESNTIIDSLRHLDTSTGSIRDIMPARKYVLPETTKLDIYSISSFDEFYNYTKSIDTLNTGISNLFNGLSKSFIDCAISILQIDNSVNLDNLQKIYNYILKVLNNIPKSENLCVKFGQNDFSIIPIKATNIDDIEIIESSELGINYFIDDFYYKKESNDTFVEYRNSILQLTSLVLNKISKKLKNINSKLDDCKNIDIYKLYGELITSNLYRLKNIITNKNFIELENYYDNNNLIKIPLDIKYSVADNAKLYFKKYNKLKNTLQIVSEQKKQTEQELNYVESIIYELDRAKTINDINEIYTEMCENKMFENLRKYKNKYISSFSNKKYVSTTEPIKIIIDNYTIMVGKNNKQNDYLTTKIAKKDDMWFHTKDIHGSHVILVTNHAKPDIDIIIKCAEIAAYYSKASMSSNVNVDYTLVKNVKKPSGAKPGMVIYTHNETITVKPNKNH